MQQVRPVRRTIRFLVAAVIAVAIAVSAFIPQAYAKETAPGIAQRASAPQESSRGGGNGLFPDGFSLLPGWNGLLIQDASTGWHGVTIQDIW